MVFDFDNLSDDFRFFYKAFSPVTYGNSMGRAAEAAAINFEKLSNKEQKLATDWFIELFEQESDYYGPPYLWAAEKMNDIRFIPLLKNYYKKLKSRHKRIAQSAFQGEIIKICPNFSSELKLCKRVIKSIKRGNKAPAIIY